MSSLWRTEVRFGKPLEYGGRENKVMEYGGTVGQAYIALGYGMASLLSMEISSASICKIRY